jgi:hypothetical protein
MDFFIDVIELFLERFDVDTEFDGLTDFLPVFSLMLHSHLRP